MPPPAIALCEENRIVISIDFGTTNTGIAWMKLQHNGALRFEDIISFQAWPNSIDEKVPSVISYTPSPVLKKKQWGKDIDPSSTTLQWTKLELEPKGREEELRLFNKALSGLAVMDALRNPQPQANGIRNGNGVGARAADVPAPGHLGLDPEDIVTDYLRKVARHWFEVFTSAEGEAVLENITVDVVVTHPAVWSYAARNKTARAARVAFSPIILPKIRNFTLCSEPEACAIYAASSKSMPRILKGDYFIVCDAGGGTVDLASYRVIGNSPLKVQQVGTISGDLCGAIFIDRRFFAWAAEILESTEVDLEGIGSGRHNSFTQDARTLFTKFEQLKHLYGSETNDETHIVLPRSLNCKRGNVLARELVKNGSLKVGEEQMNQVFSFSVGRIIDLLSRQLENLGVIARAGGGMITHILMGGGLSQNDYVMREIKTWAEGLADGCLADGLTVERPANPWNAVAIGAVAKEAGIAGTRPRPLKFFPRHFGVKIATQGENYSNIWLIRKGDIIIPGERVLVWHNFSCTFHERASARVRLEVMATQDDSPPRWGNRYQSPPEIVDFDISLKKVPRRELRRSSAFTDQLHADLLVSFSYTSGDAVTIMVAYKTGGLLDTKTISL